MHRGWDRLSRLPTHVVPCPRCSSPQDVREHNWRWDEEEGSWLCRRPACMERTQTNHAPVYWLRPRG
jgi:hypothetical protein